MQNLGRINTESKPSDLVNSKYFYATPLEITAESWERGLQGYGIEKIRVP